VVTTDAIIEGVHFTPADPIATVAMKALRVNISDLVGKGARPRAALLTLIWPNTRAVEEIAVFADALGGDLDHYGMTLIGGDTAATDGPLTVSIAAFGEPIGERTPSRADAKPGEDLWLVGGEIGSAWLGLQLWSGRMKLDELRRARDEGAAREQSRALAEQTPDYLTLPGEEFDAEAGWLISTYLAPFVQAECAEIVARFAGASMDVSDGLVADAAKLAAASGVKLRIEANAIPFSIPAERWAMSGGDFRKLITGGDDYVVLFTAAAEARPALEAAEQGRPLRLARIGRVEPGAGVEVVDRQGYPVPLPEAGYAHQLGR
jgi:thiamine-monophosphate kinase